MALYINGNKASGGTDVVHLTQAQYDALPSSKNYDDKVYMITDANGDGSQFQPVIYSETEREIGVWTDGKPLYQKTFELTIPDGGSGAYEHEFTEAAIPNLDKAVKTSYSLGNGERDYVPWYLQATVILDEQTATGVTFYFGSNNYAGRIIYYTVCYTKTTDTAGSGTWTPQGVPAVHYSTDEQVIGTWIDGSTLYEKTIEFDGSNQSITDNMTINSGIENADFICIKDAWFIDPKTSSKASSSNIITKLPYTQNSSSFLNVVIPLNNKTKIKFSSSETFTAYEGRKIIVVIQYTKSSQGGN